MRNREEMMRAMAAGMKAGMDESAMGAGLGAAGSAGAAVGKGAQGLGKTIKKQVLPPLKKVDRSADRSIEVPTEENMNRPKATRPGGPRNLMDDFKEYGMRKGGYVKSADGCAKRGKTRGRMV